MALNQTINIVKPSDGVQKHKVDFLTLYKMIDDISFLGGASTAYRKAVVMQMLGICAQESNLTYQRQLLKDQNARIGAYGLFQIETASTVAPLQLAKGRFKNESLAFLQKYGFRPPYSNSIICEQDLINASAYQISLWMWQAINDALDVLMARLFLFGIKEAIPLTKEGQAAYWKKYYNTPAGAGTPQEYLHNFDTLITPMLMKYGITPLAER